MAAHRGTIRSPLDGRKGRRCRGRDRQPRDECWQIPGATIRGAVVQVTRIQGSQFCDSKALTVVLRVAYIGPMDMFVATTLSLFASGVL